MTKIEWTRSTDGTPGKSWNPVTGCTPISAGCQNCYARRMARRLAGRVGYPEYPHQFDVTLHSDRLTEPLGWHKPRRIFVVSMGDLFHPDVPDSFIFQVWETMRLVDHHTYIVLTKRHERMREWVTYHTASWLERRPLPNVQLGVTVESQLTADVRIPLLLQTPAAVRWVSYEPALEEVDFDPWLYWPIVDWQSEAGPDPSPVYDDSAPRLDWIVAGAETGPGARPADPAWFRSVRDQCQEAGVPFFYKRGSDKSRLLDGKLHEEWPEVEG